MADNNDNRIKQFIHQHKAELCIASGTIAVLVLGYIGFKHLPDAKTVQITNVIKPVGSETNPIVKELPYKTIWSNLSGEVLTPTGLGNEMLTSAQKINKRLIEFGLQERTPCGEYMMTELGRKFGKDTWKVASSSHSFSNIEWDKSVLNIIFSPEEMIKVSELKETYAKIMSA